MPNDLITPEETKTLRDGAKTITPEMVMGAVSKREVVSVVPLKLKSGYLVSMTFDKLDGRTAEHVSVSNPDSRTDPADAEIIATAIIGDRYSITQGRINKNNIHFIKSLKL